MEAEETSSTSPLRQMMRSFSSRLKMSSGRWGQSVPGDVKGYVLD